MEKPLHRASATGTGSRSLKTIRLVRRSILIILAFSIVYYIFSRSSSLPAIPHLSASTGWPYLPNPSLPGTMHYAPNRKVDVSDAFALDNFKMASNCTISSLDMHSPFEPLCSSRTDLMAAMSNGGRAGQDMPFMPRGCDMRWYTVPEICRILSRFEQIHVLGDSLMLYLTVALHVFLRKDLINGGRLAWMDDPKGLDCRCRGAFDEVDCAWVSPTTSNTVWENDPNSMACPKDSSANIDLSILLSYPLKDDDFNRPLELIPKNKPSKPHAFIMGHGLWNNCSIPLTQEWVGQVEGKLINHAPWLGDQNKKNFKRLFVTPTAAGLNKVEVYVKRQGNRAIRLWETGIGDWIKDQGYDFLGMWNSTVQNSSPDGTHAGMKGTLLQAQMVLNWLDRLDVDDW